MSKKRRTDNNSSTSKTPPKIEICEELVDEIVNRRTFEPFNRPTVGCRFFRFQRPGESITGQLGFPIKNFQQATSYPLQLDDEEIIEIIGNRLLHKQIREGELCGQRVEIIYQGREFTHAGHYRKIYRVYKIGVEQRSSDEWKKIIKKYQRKKNGRRKVKDNVLPELPTAGHA